LTEFTPISPIGYEAKHSPETLFLAAFSVSESFSYQYLIALGSNLGDRHRHICHAQDLIAELCGPIVAISSTFETAPMGAADQTFLNSTLICEATLAPEDMLAKLLAIEVQLGRVRTVRWGNRTIDLDILLCQRTFDHQAICQDSATLNLPHPEILRRDFVLVPAAEIAGHWIYPHSQRTLEQELAVRGFELTSSELDVTRPLAFEGIKLNRLKLPITALHT
jgi:2-amino-4-hydroxy-6-hydroxymethyldihydropteridine diphosphokinase